MVRGISDSVRKLCHLLYRWGINGIVRKCSPSADVGGDLHNAKFAQRRILQYMEIRQGYSYHIKDEFFDMVQDRYLMRNKENGNYRPHFYAIQDKKNHSLYWMIPISSQVEKYKVIIEKKKRKYGKCNTIIIGKFAGKENAFLIQNAFPIIAEFFDHIHTVENKPVTVHNELNRMLSENLGEVLALYNRGIHLIFTDIDKIRTIMEQKLENTGCQ